MKKHNRVNKVNQVNKVIKVNKVNTIIEMNKRDGSIHLNAYHSDATKLALIFENKKYFKKKTNNKYLQSCNIICFVTTIIVGRPIPYYHD